ncbi:MAG: hypothetical protein LUE27_10250, partial [Clostridia bacterium]|nr:hypothetical protein [Clostridia bacterium]
HPPPLRGWCYTPFLGRLLFCNSDESHAEDWRDGASKGVFGMNVQGLLESNRTGHPEKMLLQTVAFWELIRYYFI